AAGGGGMADDGGARSRAGGAGEDEISCGGNRTTPTLCIRPEESAMPVHDSTRVRANRSHDSHQKWTVAICNEINAGRLPPGYFAMVEQKTGGPEPDVITLELTPPAGLAPGGVAVDLQPPKAWFVT